MSHNTIIVNNKKPSLDGEIALNLENLISIDNPTIGKLLQKKSNNWGVGELTLSIDGFLNFKTANSSYGTGSSQYDAGDNYLFRKASSEFNVINNNVTLPNSAGSYVPAATSSWTDGFLIPSSNFPIGSRILFRATGCPSLSSGASLSIQWYVGTGIDISQATPIGNKAYIDNYSGGTAFGLYTSDGTNKEVGLRITSKTGTVSIPNRSLSLFQNVTAKKLN
tara:strand:- start:223 stop:888 length:666 start_codon:yes stop_codon:yes gene_type:complete